MISILMPCKDAALYLRDCLDSILSQSLEEWELCVVNDHSTDDSFEILRRYAEADERIKVMQNPGKGIIPALRAALDMAGGQYVTRMDADDVMHEKKLELLCSALSKAGYGHVAVGEVEYLDNPKPGRGFLKYAKWLNELSRNGRNWEEVYKECTIPSPCWMLRREEIEKHGLFDELRYPEDYHLCLELYSRGYRIAAVEEKLHLWRDHPQRASRTDPNYADQSFIDLKLDYFLSLECTPGRGLFLWGAGPKGKPIANALKVRKAEFTWVTENPNKLGQNIYGQVLRDPVLIGQLSEPIVMVAVSQKGARGEIDEFLSAQGLDSGAGYFHLH